MKVVWSLLAEKRALEAVDYMAKDRPDGANEWLEGLLGRVAKLDRLAKRGRVVLEIGPRPIAKHFTRRTGSSTASMPSRSSS